ncbi:MAG: hypothetical protein PHW04_04640 [Candidatus Wallbacteria bacterium]|nr:hypothetical protein [Candidatus Wallbacteria bacterium]
MLVFAGLKNGYVVGIEKALIGLAGGFVFGGGLGEILCLLFPELKMEQGEDKERTDFIFPELDPDEKSVNKENECKISR